MSHPLDRPPGLAPKGSSWGLGVLTVYAPGIPGLTAMAVSPWLPGGLDTGLPLAFASVAVWVVIAVPLVIGFKSRRYWGVALYFYVAAFWAAALPIAIAVLAFLVVTTIHHRPPQFFYVWMGLGLLMMVPFWPNLVRSLRLKYWQPWTTPDEWETGDERIAGWVYDAAGVARPPSITGVDGPNLARPKQKSARGFKSRRD